MHQRNWRLVFERNGEFLGATIEALDNVEHITAYVTFQLVQVEDELLVEQHFQQQFHGEEKTVGSTKFFSWEEFTKPSRRIVRDDLACLRIKMHLVQGCGVCDGH